ncbi:MAG: hypothetical protein WA958_18045 [Tunicatimonas sp.]
MALTRNFKETVQERAARDPEFRKALLIESIECMLTGDLATGKSILRDYINATMGFEELGTLLNKSPKSVMRMFGPEGNPTTSNFFSVLNTLREKEGVNFEVHTVRNASDTALQNEHVYLDH